MLYCTDITTYPYNNTGLTSNVSGETIKGLRCSIMELYHTKLDCAKPLASDYYLLDEVCGFTSLNNFIENIYDVYSQGVVSYFGTDTTPGTLPEVSLNAIYLCRHITTDSYDDRCYYWNIYLGYNSGYINTGIKLLNCYQYPNRICGICLSGEDVCLGATSNLDLTVCDSGNYIIGTYCCEGITGYNKRTGIWGRLNCRSSGFKAEELDDCETWYGYSRCLNNDKCWFFGECNRNGRTGQYYIKGIINNNDHGVCLGQFKPYSDGNVYRKTYNKEDDIGLICLGADICVITNNCMWSNCDITIHCFSSSWDCCEGRLYVSQDNGCNWHKYVLDCDLNNYNYICSNLISSSCSCICDSLYVDDICVYSTSLSRSVNISPGLDTECACVVHLCSRSAYFDGCVDIEGSTLTISDGRLIVGGEGGTLSMCCGCITADSIDLCCSLFASYIEVDDIQATNNIYTSAINAYEDTAVRLNVCSNQFALCCDGHIYFNGNRLI